jgi:predicted MFS family arabinose efflux permease
MATPARSAPPAPAPPATARLAGHVRFWGAAYTGALLLAGTNLATPLYRDYERAFGFSSLGVTLVFSAYVAVLIPSLLIAGPLSDAIGRRRVVLPAIGLAAAGSLLFALAGSTGWLFAARVVQGLAMGAAAGPVTAVLVEVEPNGNRRRAAVVAAVASVGGVGAGPLLAGLLAQYTPAPRVTPFVVDIALLVPAALAMATLPAARETTRWRPRRPEVPTAIRRVFAVSGAASFLAWAVVGLFLTLVPAYVTTLTGSHNLALGGGVAALLLACSALAQVAAYGRPPRGVLAAGLPLLAAGLVLLGAAGATASLPVLLAATAVAGAGQGLAFLGAMTEVNRVAPPDRHADVLSSFYVVTYLGTGTPVIGVGFLATTIGLLPAVQSFGVAVGLASLVLLGLVVRSRSQSSSSRIGSR